MSDGTPPQFPPPGAPPPESPGPAYPPPGPTYGPPTDYPPYTGPQPPTYGGMHGAAHKPGAIPLRPLDLGAIYDGAFRIIRFNPKATVGAAVLVTAVANLVPILITAALTLLMDVPFAEVMSDDPNSMNEATIAEMVGVAGVFLSMVAGAFATWFGLVFVTGMVAHVAHAAAVGRKLTLGQAWQATHGQRWRLVGLNLVLTLMLVAAAVAYAALWVVLVAIGEPVLLVLFGLISVPAVICGLLWFWIKVYYLPVPALMLERTGVFAAIGRGYRLTAGQYWRIFGIALLTWLITTVASQALGFPLSMVGQLVALAVPDYGWLIYVLTNSLVYVLVYAFIAPFTGAVVALQYLDQRMRKEAHDVELMREAGLMDR